MQPKPARDRQRINLGLLPPRGFVTMPVQLSMVDTAHRNGELVADPSARGWAKRRWWASAGKRPHTKQDCEATKLRWSLSRRRMVFAAIRPRPFPGPIGR